MRRIEFVHLNVALLVVILVLAGLYRPQLSWAWRGLPLYLMGRFPQQAELALYNAGLELLKSGEQRDRAKALLERSISIDPHSAAVLVLGEAYFQEGDLARALQHFHEFQRIDPSALLPYLRISEIHERLKNEGARREILERGVAYFESQVERFRPIYDPSVASRFNAKARAVYESYRKSLATLRERL